jgi:hypothetical protein
VDLRKIAGVPFVHSIAWTAIYPSMAVCRNIIATWNGFDALGEEIETQSLSTRF